jgi:hypothetical protein
MTRGVSAVPPSHRALCQALRRNKHGLLKLLAKIGYSRSLYYRRLHQLGEPPADVVIEMADWTGLPRRGLLETCGVI